MSLIIKNVHKSYKKVKRKKVLNGVNLEIEKNTICSIIGLNGAGKSTLIKSILGLVLIDSGKIEFNGSDIKNVIYKGKVGYMPELMEFTKSIKLKKYLLDMASIKNNSDTEIIEKFLDELLDIFSLKCKENEYIYSFSKGMKKKVAFIQAILNKPELLILDEPTDGLDPQSRRNMLNIIKDLRNNGTTVLITSHILTDLELITDKVAIINSGVLIKEINKKENHRELNLNIKFKDNTIEKFEIIENEGIFKVIDNNSKLISEISISKRELGLEEELLIALEGVVKRGYV